jgi:hypothetical protein
MVVGGGLMARVFAPFGDAKDLVIFASGVSNSSESDPAAFARERDLLLRVRAAHPAATLTYFGTCSVNDPEQRDTPYVRHKLEMESLLKESQGPWLVLRFPLVIGHSPGSRTLAQFLYDRIMRGDPLEVWQGASRHPIDADDAFRIGNLFIRDQAMRSRRINIAIRSFPVLEFVHAFERITERKANYTLVNKGRAYALDCPEVAGVSDRLGLDYSDRYLERVLRKYFGR